VLDRGADGLYRPSSEDEIGELVRWARDRGRRVRVRGTGHSIDPAIYSGVRNDGAPSDGIDLSLDRYAGIRFEEERREVTVEGGCRLGGDPRDRSGRGAVEAGLCWQLEQRGWALPVTAGITHQTVAGFLMTGSAGGSRRHSLLDQLVSMRLIDASGEVHELSPERDGDLFEAAGVSLGLLGVVSSVTLRCTERFDVAGEERIVRVSDAPFDLGADGNAGVEGFLTEAEYGRVYWWPQEWVEKLAIWSAARLPDPLGSERHPYRQLPEILGSTVPAQAVAGTLVAVASRASRWSRPAAATYNVFMPAGPPRPFKDGWWRALPMDDDLDERFFPSTWTEMWIPAEATGEALRRLREHYRRGGFAATGAYTVELYAAPASRFWLAPGFARDSVRINVCWHERSRGNPRTTYFPQFWDLLADLRYRLHWGKHLFEDRARTAAQIGPTYPRWADFLEARDSLDPDGLFLSEYWREHLGLPQRRARPRVRPGQMGDATRSATTDADPAKGWRLPLLFPLRPSDPGFAERAEFVVDIQETVSAAPEPIFDSIVDLKDASAWLEDFVRAEWVLGPDERGHQVVDEVFRFFTQRVRTLHAERGRRWKASWEACTLPIARQLLEDLELTPLDGGRTLVRWRFYHEPFAAMRPLNRLFRRGLESSIRESLARLEAHLSRTSADAR
jgi:FAD/FMN-containing dehydrogenase